MAKPKLALIPAAQGSKFYSVLPSDGVGDFDFARASAATRINKYGLIETVASGQSRLNYPLIDGVVKGCPSYLLEPAKTNLQVYSEQFDNAAWTKTNLTVNTNQTISPNGELTADLLTTTSASGSYVLDVAFVTAAQKYNYSVFVKKSNVNFFAFVIVDGVNVIRQYYDINNGVVGSSVNSGTPIVENIKIENYGNGWYRCSLTIQALNSAVEFRNYVIENDGIATAAIGSKIFLWGAQIEQGSYATSYIPTEGSSVTRVAETAANAGDASTFNDSEGVFMAELLWTATSSNIYISIDDNTSNNRVLIYSTSTDDIKALVGSGGSTQAAFTAINQDPTTFSKVAVKYKQNDFALWINGFEVATDTSGNTPIGLNTSGFRAGGGTTPFHGSTKQIQYYETALNSEELETLTSWVSFQDMAESQLYTIE